MNTGIMEKGALVVGGAQLSREERQRWETRKREKSKRGQSTNRTCIYEIVKKKNENTQVY